MSRSLVLAEADAASRILFTRVLSGRGANVFTASTAPETVTLVRQAAPDLLIMSMHLPGIISGFELARIIHNISTRPMPIVALTTDPRILHHRHRHLLDAVLLKPFAMHELLQLIYQTPAELVPVRTPLHQHRS